MQVNGTVHGKTPWRYYLGCGCPLLAVILLLLVLAFLTQIVESDSPRLPLRDFTPLQDYPDAIDLAASTLIAETGLKWLALSYFYWLVGLVTLGFCIFRLQRAFAQCSRALRNATYTLFFLLLVATLAALYHTAVVREIPLMSFIHLLRHLQLVGQGLLELASWNNALAYLNLVAIMAVISLLLVPGVHERDPGRQMRAVTRVMYCAAAFLLVWIAQATEMYRLAACLLVAEERDKVLQLAPTISLVAGVLASLLLAASYLAACLWLQWYYQDLRKSDATQAVPDASASPRQFLHEHWPKITAVMMPILPGVMGTVFNLVTQTV
ncbi:hypothetical protein G8764_05875 [Pseudomaricurvus alcaniphilus]|uniref:hypothetical protein n=1 Tax=Pseudomaricurvus alcaniphilus TaxID=1166482 RepID=UPI0014091E9E|nr:hypothetical protein [Pseudomaricurvus alcaniphilus]NHN36820.1 hypothetical protein [Pseudomaricurvus alcaniphilus]